MIENTAFLPGIPPADTLPLDRFLPPVHSGSAVRWLADHASPGSLILDPFGASPRLSLELARAGYRVLVAANNPVARFILEMLASQPSQEVLTTSLAHLAAARVRDERLEPHLLSLYHTPCNSCSTLVSADEFLWERDAEAPFARIYTCPNCGDSGEYPTTPFDADMARKTAATSLNYARILERVAGLKDPDRKFAEEAIRYYPPRAVYALGILVNKLETFPSPDVEQISALLLTTFDLTNTLWPYPTSRPRPRQLTVPPRFREHNVFRALEQSIQLWSNASGEVVPLVNFPDTLAEGGGICIYRGAMRDLADHVPKLDIKAVLTVMPRPNQAFWKMSALWAGWLGGREAVQPFKPVLRRQRYDWRWHTSALHAALRHLVPQLGADIPYLSLLVETEPGLLSSGLIAGRRAGLEIRGLALREEDEVAQVHWRSKTEVETPAREIDPAITAVQAAKNYLEARGEPATFLLILAAVLQAGPNFKSDSGETLSPADVYAKTIDLVQDNLTYIKGFLRYNAGKELDIGSWWLRNDPETIPLGDRIEQAVRDYLQNNPGSPLKEIDQAICKEFTGLFTPDQGLISTLVESYGAPFENDGWQLRAEDDPVSRKNEVNHHRRRIIQLGEKLGFHVSTDGPIRWADSNEVYLFHITTTAELGGLLQNSITSSGRKLFVIPGSRSNLVLHKRRRDPRLDFLLKDWYFLKFRHLRALSKNPLIDRANIESQFLMDELTYESPQLKLF